CLKKGGLSLIEKELADKTGLTYSADISALMQRGAPNGHKSAWQTIYYGNVNWAAFQSDTIGAGSVQLSYNAVRYWGTDANTIASRIGVVSGINDYTEKSNAFDQLSYTHQFPQDLKWLSVTIGQFPLYIFDGSAYLANQQTNFLNFALSQNATSTYPTASLGGYATIAPNDEYAFTIGMQDARNVSGTSISAKKFGKGTYTAFVSASYTPTINGGQDQYSLLLYNQPGVPAAPGNSRGWSINWLHYLTPKLAVTGRINGAVHSSESIRQSYVLGFVYNNPFNRNALDQFGFAGAVNKLNKAENGSDSRSVENVLETYYSFGLSNFVTLTPDIQFYINPGADKQRHTATVASVRATVMF
ncbi:MAG: carbohydrate porin, partial [Alphaproteobacteria bacterium]